MDADHEMRFYHQYHPFKPARAVLMVPPTHDFTEETPDNAQPTDTIIKIGETRKTWAVHVQVIVNQSNYFRRAIASGFLESSTRIFELYEIDAEAMDFVVKYFYQGWHEAASHTFGLWTGDLMKIKDMAKIMILADYLDIPALCYDAYRQILSKLARLVVDARSDIQFAHNLYVKKKPFVEAIDVLDNSRNVLGVTLSVRMKRFLRNLHQVHDLANAIRVYREAFADDVLFLDRELQW
ncbi:hypothetical protein F5Y05DRAFT_420927 [Hypoxylon sp. FL0543]|nr:hypothetical protein F5Y05DRAFT_420927 [Hypoxylon sp. FL0543]